MLLQIERTIMMRVNKYNVNLSIHQRLGWTAGHVAAVCGNLEQAKMLMELGFNPDKGDKNGWTARQLSVDLHGKDIFKEDMCDDVRPLPEPGQDFKMMDAHVAAISGKPLPLLQCLNKDMNAFQEKDFFGYTPLDYLDLLHHDGDYYRRLIAIRRELAAN